jgi:hypothetical protein
MKRLVLAGAVLALLCAAGGTASARAPSPKPRAAREAQRLLDAYVPPKGAVRLRALPKGVDLSFRIPGSLVGKRLDRHRFWHVPASVDAIAGSFPAKLRGWGAPAITSTQGKRGLAATEAFFSAVGFGGRATDRLLYVNAVKARGGGSFLRADVIVVWRLSAAEREDLPAGVRGIDISGPHAREDVTDRAQVRTIVRWFDHLQIDESLVFLGCPVMPHRPSFTFAFRGAHGTVARASVPEFSAGCSPASYTLRGHAQSSLLAGDFDYRVQELLGANWIGPPDTLGRADRRKGEAARTAAALLHAFEPPAGAVRIHKPTEYGGVLRSVPTPLGEFVRRTRYWHVDAKPAAVVAFLQAHDVPSGFTPECGTNPRFGSQCDLHAGDRYLEYSVQRKVDGTSILRVDAQVVWVYPRSLREVVPSGVREIDVTTPTGTTNVSDPAKVGRIVRWFDHLPIYPPGIGTPMCGPTLGHGVMLVFHSATGARVADAQAPAGSASMCDPITFTLRGIPQTALVDNVWGATFASRLQHLLGVKLS